jgi:hypothetical protein
MQAVSNSSRRKIEIEIEIEIEWLVGEVFGCGEIEPELEIEWLVGKPVGAGCGWVLAGGRGRAGPVWG